ncbi:aspartate/glutamate racemase family protein [Alkaliphilus serpentinus]|uniref:Aspartate/glutamate racemase family protein n=1 Tax=Alkaliphilus serpentinus TaxID=1482731 RepID=A0A833M849_9FIRM|nr:amino acid racemase [Alkaliphilus serpentinus]KAB3530056.1 aspartate/glutamate racemase family protein [Alkaliphilus serpentinus]
MYKTVGIIGGMGPEATLYLFQRIIKLTKASCDQEHIPIIIDNNTKITDRTDFLLGKGISPSAEIVKSANRLKAMGAEIIAMACNTAHCFCSEIVNMDISFINMIQITADYILNKYGREVKVGLLATKGVYISGIYNEACKEYSIEIVEPEEGNIQVLMDIYL